MFQSYVDILPLYCGVSHPVMVIHSFGTVKYSGMVSSR